MSKKLKVELSPDDLVVVDENHGGYTSGHCIVCGASGWINGKYGLKATSPDAREWRGSHLVHKRKCPMNQVAAEKRD